MVLSVECGGEMLPLGHVGVPQCSQLRRFCLRGGPCESRASQGPSLHSGGPRSPRYRITGHIGEIFGVWTACRVQLGYTHPHRPGIAFVITVQLPPSPVSLPKPSPPPPAPTTGPKPHSFAGCQLPSAAAEPSPGGASRRRPSGGPGVPTAAPRSFIFWSSASRTLPLFFFLTTHNHFRAVCLRLSSRQQHPSLFPTTNNQSTTTNTTTTTTRSSLDLRITLHHISGKHHGISLCTSSAPEPWIVR